MKKLLHNSKALVLLTLGLAGLGTYSLWQGETTNDPTDKQRPARRSVTDHGEESRTDDPRHRPAHRQENHKGGIHGNDTSPPLTTEAAKLAMAKRPRNVDGSIMRRAAGAAHKAAKNTQAGVARVNLRNILASAGLSARQRVAALENLRSSGSLSDEDRAAAGDYLANATPPEGTSPAQHHWIVDELISTLRADGADNAALSRSLAAIYQNKSQHMVVRDYALQHLGHLRAEGADPAPIDTTLHTATTEKQGTIAGTALLALNQDREGTRTGETALKVATDTAMDLRSRITAMQVAGKQGNTEALPVAAATAADNNQPAALRMAAIATLGDLKAKDQQPLLQTLSRSRNSRLSTAAKAALKKLAAANE